MADLVASDPSPSAVALVTAFIRQILPLAAGAGFMWAKTVTADQTTMIATALVAVGSLGWSLWQKIVAARREDVIANESAARGVPVQPPPAKV